MRDLNIYKDISLTTNSVGKVEDPGAAISASWSNQEEQLQADCLCREPGIVGQ
jgi:hypothetical protein